MMNGVINSNSVGTNMPPSPLDTRRKIELLTYIQFTPCLQGHESQRYTFLKNICDHFYPVCLHVPYYITSQLINIIDTFLSGMIKLHGYKISSPKKSKNEPSATFSGNKKE